MFRGTRLKNDFRGIVFLDKKIGRASMFLVFFIFPWNPKNGAAKPLGSGEPRLRNPDLHLIFIFIFNFFALL